VDGVNWTTISTINSVPYNGMHYIQLETPTTYRYIRYQVPAGAPKNSYNPDSVYCCNLAEFTLYGKGTVIKGDINNDDKFNSIDVLLLKRWIIEANLDYNDLNTINFVNYKAGDFDNNGTLDIIDIGLMKKELLKTV
jgi:hypothetical protein